MQNKLQVIHLSDLHIGYKSCGEKAGRIVKNIIAQETGQDTVIIITGDIVDQAKTETDMQSALKLIRELRDHGFVVLLVPGNHDYGTGFVNSRKTAQRFHELFLPELESFPRLDVIKNTAFIGLDSNEDELHWYDRFFADGEIGGHQLAGLEEMLNDPSLSDKIKVVYLHHHPFPYVPLHQLKDSKKLKAVVENKIDVLLWGHLHFGAVYKNVWGAKLGLDAGSSSGKRAVRVISMKLKHRVIKLPGFIVEERDYLRDRSG